MGAMLFESLGLSKLIENQPPTLFAKIALWFVALSIWLLAYIFLKRPRYEFFPELGLKGNIKKGLWFCPKCQNPLRIEKDHFYCITCKDQISLPDRKVAEMVWKNQKQRAYL
jgi:hypothetical protein